MLEPQYQVGPDGFEPRLAESWSSEANADGTVTWSFKLREGVVSCAGNTLSSDDVIYTWQRAKSLSGGAPIGWFLGNVAAVLGLEVFGETAETDGSRDLLDSEVAKIDDLNFTITQMSENDLFPRVQAITFQGIFDSAVMLEQATEDDPWAHNFTETENIPGFGAYCPRPLEQGHRDQPRREPERLLPWRTAVHQHHHPKGAPVGQPRRLHHQRRC